MTCHRVPVELQQYIVGLYIGTGKQSCIMSEERKYIRKSGWEIPPQIPIMPYIINKIRHTFFYKFIIFFDKIETRIVKVTAIKI